MKLNWGTSIVIAFALFMAFILSFVFWVQGNPKYDNELVVEEYYKKDARFSEEMDKLQNAANLEYKPTISQGAEGVRMDFPKEYKGQPLTGQVVFYRPSGKKMDFTVPLHLIGQSQLVSKEKLEPGLWSATLSWNFQGKDFMIKKDLYIN